MAAADLDRYPDLTHEWERIDGTAGYQLRLWITLDGERLMTNRMFAAGYDEAAARDELAETALLWRRRASRS